MNCVHIFKNGDMDEYIIKDTSINNSIECSHLQSISKSQGEGELKLLYKWSSDDNLIQCFGWYDGDNAFENNHTLPPGGISTFLDEDSSEITLYGDIFLVLYNDKSIINFTISDYAAFHDFIYDSVDDLNCSDDETINSEEEKVEYEDDTNELTDEEYEESFENIEELDYDNNEY